MKKPGIWARADVLACHPSQLLFEQRPPVLGSCPCHGSRGCVTLPARCGSLQRAGLPSTGSSACYSRTAAAMGGGRWPGGQRGWWGLHGVPAGGSAVWPASGQPRLRHQPCTAVHTASIVLQGEGWTFKRAEGARCSNLSTCPHSRA
jgi:hypothetical protein